MNSNTELSQKWIKAAMLGTIWAASEIVLGSFLHNLRIPFSGNILTAIGLVILIAASYIWREKGIVWRAGIVCAILKTMSPSAVILEPMVAIIVESLILELAIRSFGKNVIGYLLGATLAMVYILIQIVARFVLVYGFKLVVIYERLMMIAKKQLNAEFDLIWMPIIVLIFTYAVFGLFAGVIGMNTGAQLLRKSQQPISTTNNQFENFSLGLSGKQSFNYSVIWLVLNFMLMFTVLFTVNRIPFLWWVILVIGIIIVWGIRYRMALKQLMKPKFWFAFFAITMLTTLVFSEYGSNKSGIIGALLIGAEMNLRAIIMIVGFSVIGTEFFNPNIKKYLSNGKFRQVSLAVELSLDSLPFMIVHIPKFKELLKNPMSVIIRIIQHADHKIENSFKPKQKKANVIFLQGGKHEGKTTQIIRIIEALKLKGIDISGVFSSKIQDNNIVLGYDAINIKSNNSIPIMRLDGPKGATRIGRFYISQNGFDIVNNEILKSIDSQSQLVILDEIGKLEIVSGGWSKVVEKLLQSVDLTILMVVRDKYIDDLVEKWEIESYKVYSLVEEEIQELISKLVYGMK